MSQPLINNKYLLEKFPGKGGWTYARIPEISQNKNNPFGWVKVRGSIDDIKFEKYHLMPMGNGQLFLPVKAEIRKKINKKEGDWVQVILFPDDQPLAIPAGLTECLKDEPPAFRFFNSLSESEQKYYIDWIFSAKKETTQTERMANAINRLAQKLKMHDKE